MSWLIPSIPGWSRQTPSSSSTSTVDPPHTHDHQVEIDQVDEDIDIDAPPPFPMLDSHQRSKAKATPTITPAAPALAPPASGAGETASTTKSTPIESKSIPVSSADKTPTPTPSFSVAPPSPEKTNDDAEPPSDLNIAIVDAPLGNMAPPPSTTQKPKFGLQVGGDQSEAHSKRSTDTKDTTSNANDTTETNLMPVFSSASNRGKKGGSGIKIKGKVALSPGHSALDWARLQTSGQDLRGVNGFQRVTLAELKKHNTRDDAWSVFNGMVYNITAYVPFHPGGEKELMRVAGRDGTKLFMLTHSWVNLDFMLKECLIGVLVRG